MRSPTTSSKWHALGNSYLVLEGDELRPARARAIVGDMDGIVEVLARGDDWAQVRIWNPDGSTAELSGNGTRIAARWLADQTGARRVRIQIGERETSAHLLDGGAVDQDLGPVRVRPAEEIEGLKVIPVDVGNPHAVVEGDPADITWIGPKLETHARFPQRTNVQVASIDGPGVVTARVWERGVGETSSSGTSAVAVAAACIGEGATVVRFPGGELHVRIEHGRAHLIGPAERIS